MKNREVHAFLDERGHGQLFVDGIDLSDYLTGINLQVKPLHSTLLTLEVRNVLKPHLHLHAEVEADVRQWPEPIATAVYEALHRLKTEWPWPTTRSHP